MPKKFQGENTKAVEAKARKNAQKEAEVERKKQAEEDEYWRDDDKSAQKKLQRKDERLKKQQELLERKQQNKALLEKELQCLAASTAAKSQPIQKVTRAEISSKEEIEIKEQQKEDERRRLAAKNISVVDDSLPENVNRLVIEGDEARTVEEALQVLGATKEKMDRNPEKRLLSTYLSYEEKNLPRIKAENPNLRLSQLKQMLKKEWQKSPENPMNAGI